MSQGSQLFLAPCSREYKTETYEHFQNTVVDGVDADLYPALRRAGFEGKIGVWGVVSGNRPHWKRLEPGDVVLFYTKSGVYTHLAEVIETEHNELVGEQLWTTYDGKRLVQDLEEPWPFLIYLSNVQRVDIPAEDVHEALGYSMQYPQGFMRPTDERQETLVEEFGSIRDFLWQYSTAPLTERTPSIEESVDQLVSQLDQESALEVQSNYTETEQVIRSSAFRRRVYEIYDGTCAVCGARRVSPQGQPEIEAAHIYPKHRDGNDDIRNGLGLCRLHHWAFDVGWLSVADEYELLVRDERRQGYEEFSRLAGRRIRLPDEERLRPHSKFLRAHRAIHGFAES